MKQTLHETRDFLRLFALWLLMGAVLLLMTDKHELHLGINSLHHPVAAWFFKYATHLGDGLFAGFIALLVFFYKVRYGIVASISFAGSGLLAQLLKRQVFSDLQRPAKVFEHLADLHFVDGVSLHHSFSFPSGHSTTAFSIFFLLGFLSGNRVAGALCMMAAVLIAFSRVYIHQHFFEDVYAGSIIGTGFTLLIVAVFRNRTWGGHGLLSTFDKKR